MSYSDCSSDNENQFETGVNGASNVTMGPANRMKPGSHIMLKGFPCKVTSFATAKPGKHGSAKAMITGKDIFTEKAYEHSFHTSEMVPVPIVEKIEYMLLGADKDGYLQLMNLDDGEKKEDIKISEEDHLKATAKKIKDVMAREIDGCLVIVQKWGAEEQLISCREQ